MKIFQKRNWRKNFKQIIKSNDIRRRYESKQENVSPIYPLIIEKKEISLEERVFFILSDLLLDYTQRNERMDRLSSSVRYNFQERILRSSSACVQVVRCNGGHQFKWKAFDHACSNS